VPLILTLPFNPVDLQKILLRSDILLIEWNGIGFSLLSMLLIDLPI
jgi:hypothetical protein